jgi:hypothetical protein
MGYDHKPDDPNFQVRLDNELRMDPELIQASTNGAKITMFAIAIAVILGVVFYGVNNSPINQTGTSSTAQNTQSSPPVAPPGMRDVTPRRANTDPGATTGAAPAQPQTTPSTNNAPANRPTNK